MMFEKLMDPPTDTVCFIDRDPKDMALSFFHFLQGWFFEEGEISLEMFLQEFVFARGKPEGVMNNSSFWENIASWWPHRKDANVLWLHFEDLKEDLPGCVKLVAEFIGVGADDKNLQQLVVKQVTLLRAYFTGTLFDMQWADSNYACSQLLSGGSATSKPARRQA